MEDVSLGTSVGQISESGNLTCVITYVTGLSVLTEEAGPTRPQNALSPCIWEDLGSRDLSATNRHIPEMETSC